MALSDLMAIKTPLVRSVERDVITEERVRAILEPLRDAVAFWRAYPDMFAEYLCGDNPEKFKLFPYQRVFLRAGMRHKYTYAVYPRAYSKSFLSVLILMIRCVLYPGSKLFITTGGKI